jgi:hypothetical protein
MSVPTSEVSQHTETSTDKVEIPRENLQAALDLYSQAILAEKRLTSDLDGDLSADERNDIQQLGERGGSRAYNYGQVLEALGFGGDLERIQTETEQIAEAEDAHLG